MSECQWCGERPDRKDTRAARRVALAASKWASSDGMNDELYAQFREALETWERTYCESE
jgi:hypothetical protein